MSVIPNQSQASSRGARMLRTALGPEISAWLEDASVIEVMLNPDGRLWIDRLGAGLTLTLLDSLYAWIAASKRKWLILG